MKKKVLAVILTAVCTMGLMAGCGNSNVGNTNTQKNASSAEDGYKIGISQFAEHGSLDNCREGFLEGLKEEGIEEGKNLTVDYQNAQTDTGTASTIADSFVSAKEDLICAIATPCAQSAYNSAMNADIPVVYTAVSDPVAAKLANEDGSCVGNVTGSSDVLPVEEQLKMIRAMLPDAKKIDGMLLLNALERAKDKSLQAALLCGYIYFAQAVGRKQAAEHASAELENRKERL